MSQATAAKASPVKPPRFQELYDQNIVPVLLKSLQRTNRLAIPRLSKIVLNIGCGEAAHDAKVLEEVQRDLAFITGQRPAVTRAKKAISNFKIQANDPVGCKVTLRKRHMYEFLHRLVSVALPRIRDFRGLSLKGFDQQGNYSFGLQELTVFPELRLDEVHYALGMDVTIVTTARTPEEAKTLLLGFGMPFEKPHEREKT